ncbi:MAG: hypothetical protein JST00_04375 [Deltaproteobacteria bacterium]|nr:hypothetical protein [Deltaproteobacteria bacterium]
MTRASIVLATAALVAASTRPACGGSACSLEDLDARSRFVEDSVGKDAPSPWDGEAVVIDIAAAGAGGIEVRAAPETTKVIATATFVAVADTYDKESADLSIADAKAGFAVETVGKTTTVRCPNGKDHGSSLGADAGCEKVVVSLPLGAADKPLRLTVRARRGALAVSTGTAVLAQADLAAAEGDIDAALPATKGSTVTLTAEAAGAVTVRVPAAFAADRITLDAAQGTIDTSAFPGLVSGQGRGPAGEGFASLALVSRPKDGRGGRVVIAAQ